MAVHHDLELNQHQVFLVAKLLTKWLTISSAPILRAKRWHVASSSWQGVALFQEIQSCKMLQKCLRKSPTKWNWQLNYHVLLQIALELSHFMPPAVSPAFWRHAKMLLSGRQISMWLPDFCTRASAEVSTKPTAGMVPRSTAIRNSHGPNPRRKNCQKISITQCKTASKATQILLMRIINRMNSHISPWTGLTYPQITWFSFKKIHHHTILNR